jgi:hypothetical protein
MNKKIFRYILIAAITAVSIGLYLTKPSGCHGQEVELRCVD